MEYLIVASCLLLLMAIVLFSMRKQLSAMFRGQAFNDPKLRQLLDHGKLKSKDDSPSDAS